MGLGPPFLNYIIKTSLSVCLVTSTKMPLHMTMADSSEDKFLCACVCEGQDILEKMIIE